MTSLAQQPGAPAVILLHEEVDNDLQHFHSVYYRSKILTEAGRKYADVTIPYYRDIVRIEQVSGRTVHADGSVAPFEGKPFDKVIVRGRAGRFHVKAFTLPDVQVGSILDYRYHIRYSDRKLLSPQWILREDLFQKKATFKFVPYQKEVVLAHGQIGQGISWASYLPSGYELKQHSTPGNALQPGGYWVDLTVTDVPAFIEEPYMPPPQMLKWRVHFYYRAGSKPEDFWKDEGKFWNKEVESFLGHDKGVAAAVAATVGPNDPPEQKARKLYAFVIALENQSYIPWRPQQEQKALGLEPNKGVGDVLRQRSGDHDELNRLFVAMARAAGLRAWLIRVPSRDETFFDKNYLSASQFDAEVAIVEIDGKEVYLDPGSKYCPFGLLQWRYSNSGGLRQSATRGTEFGETPLSSYNQALLTRLARLKLTNEGTVEGTVGVAFYGIEAMNRRREGGRTDPEGRKKMLEEEMQRWLPGGAEVTLTNEPKWDDTESELVAQFKISSPLATSAGRRWVLPPELFEVNGKPMFWASQRTNPVYLDYPVREVDEIHITLPANAEIESLPSDGQVKLDYALYRTQYRKESANTILARRELVMAGVAFQTKEYKDLKDFYDKVKAGDDQQVIVQAAAHAEGN